MQADVQLWTQQQRSLQKQLDIMTIAEAIEGQYEGGYEHQRQSLAITKKHRQKASVNRINIHSHNSKKGDGCNSSSHTHEPDKEPKCGWCCRHGHYRRECPMWKWMMAKYDAEMSSTAATATTNSIERALVPYNDQSAEHQAEERKELF